MRFVYALFAFKRAVRGRGRWKQAASERQAFIVHGPLRYLLGRSCNEGSWPCYLELAATVQSRMDVRASIGIAEGEDRNASAPTLWGRLEWKAEQPYVKAIACNERTFRAGERSLLFSTGGMSASLRWPLRWTRRVRANRPFGLGFIWPSRWLDEILIQMATQSLFEWARMNGLPSGLA